MVYLHKCRRLYNVSYLAVSFQLNGNWSKSRLVLCPVKMECNCDNSLKTATTSLSPGMIDSFAWLALIVDADMSDAFSFDDDDDEAVEADEDISDVNLIVIGWSWCDTIESVS